MLLQVFEDIDIWILQLLLLLKSGPFKVLYLLKKYVQRSES